MSREVAMHSVHREQNVESVNCCNSNTLADTMLRLRYSAEITFETGPNDGSNKSNNRLG